MAFPFLAVIQAAIGPVTKLIDSLVTTDEERLQFKQKMFELQLGMYEKFLDYETRLTEAQSKIIVAEASSDSWIAKNWRPITMLIFVGLVVCRWFGFSAPNVTPEIESQLWTLIQIGLGGYIGGRSIEKIAETVGTVMDKRNKA